MRVWLVTVGEPLPSDEGSSRMLRTGILANMLAERGHHVTWWTSTFDHVRKRHRYGKDSSIALMNGISVKLLHGCGYRANISLRRILDHVLVARRFVCWASLEHRPDVLLCSLPTLELSVAAVRYGKQCGVPVIIDVRDLWPELFLEVVPGWTRPFFDLLCAPMRRQAREACQGALAITGNSPHFVEWGLAHAGRPATRFDRTFPFGYVASPPSAKDLEMADAFWTSQGIIKSEKEFVVCFFGAFSVQFEFETVLEAAILLESSEQEFKFVLCGAGERLEFLKRRATASSSVFFPGWIGASEIFSLMRKADVGLAPYRSHIGFLGNFPNKPIEYMSAGLPVISSLRGCLEEFLAQHECGLTYPNSDPHALANILMDLFDHREKLAQMGGNSRRVFADMFDAGKVYTEMIEYLVDIVDTYSCSSVTNMQIKIH